MCAPTCDRGHFPDKHTSNHNNKRPNPKSVTKYNNSYKGLENMWKGAVKDGASVNNGTK